MRHRFTRGTAPPERRGATSLAGIALRFLAPRLLALALVSGLLESAPASAADSPDLQMRRARSALDRGAEAAAAADLEAVRRAEPASSRGLEAAVLLADLRASSGDAAAADAILASSLAALPEGSAAAAPLLLARGWLAVGTHRSAAARAHFEAADVPASGTFAREIARLGTAWSSLASAEGGIDVTGLRALASRGSHPALRFASGWTLARAYARSGEHRLALHALRDVRRQVRATPYEDDLELALGLAQLEAGKAGDARRTLQRLQRRFGTAPAEPEVHDGLRLDDLRLSPEDFSARVADLYAERTPRTTDLVRFVARLLDRPAARDVKAALALVEASAGAEGGAS
ncbi:MAG: hypothetical protein FJ144_01300 [Deltaproteobacteria bacterium]|nr:hypothetical protein [Deltaproteobacteria bacterium]